MSLLSHAATIIAVSDMPKSLRFYTDTLDFSPSYLHDNPVTYAVLKQSDMSIHLALSTATVNPVCPLMYFFVHDLTAIHAKIERSYSGNISDVQSWDYGMHEFEVEDPDGHILIFGKHEDRP